MPNLADNFSYLFTKELVDQVSDNVADWIFDREAQWKAFIDLNDEWEAKFIKRMIELFDEQEAEILSNMGKTKGVVRKDQVDFWVFGLNRWEDKYEEAAEELYTGAIVDNGSRVMGELPVVGVSFDQYDPKVTTAVDERAFRFRDVSTTTAQTVRSTLVEGLEKGEGIPELKKRVQNTFRFARETRAPMIARTETIHATNAAAEMSYMQSGVVEGKEWLCEFSKRTCDFCRWMNGKTMGLGENFHDQGGDLWVKRDEKGNVIEASPGEVGAKQAKFDFEHVKYPPLHPNCRCTLLPILKSF